MAVVLEIQQEMRSTGFAQPRCVFDWLNSSANHRRPVGRLASPSPPSVRCESDFADWNNSTVFWRDCVIQGHHEIPVESCEKCVIYTS